MRIVILAVMFLLVVGCKQSQQPQLDGRINKDLKEWQWEESYAAAAQTFTTRSYQCDDEMLTLAYTPVESGPVCKAACDLFHKVNAMVDSAPTYVPNARQYWLGKDYPGCFVPHAHSHTRKENK